MATNAQSAVVGGTLAATLTLTSALSYAALIFSGDLASGLRFGMTEALLAAAVLSVALSCFGSLPFAIGSPNGNAAAVIAVAATAIDRTLQGSGLHASILPTVLVAISITTILTGLSMYVLGLVHAGRWMRFIPYPVMGGILGAAGWIFVNGSLRVIGTASPIELAVGLGFGCVLALSSLRFKHMLVMPGLLAAGIAAFYAVLLIRGMSLAQARAAGWLFTVPHGSPFETAWSPSTLASVDWKVLASHLPDLVTLIVISVLMLLLVTSGLELATRREGDLDRELRVQGLANVVCGIGGGLSGNAAIASTMMSFRVAGPSRLPPLIVAGSSLLMLAGGAVIAGGIPRYVFGALIFSAGFALLYEWCVRAARRLPLSDYLSILAIIVVVARFGYVAGLFAGILIGTVIFVVKYSHVRVIKHDLTGAEFHSGVVRSPAELEMLRSFGSEIRILMLQDFIFFGMADRLYRAVKALLDDNEHLPQFLVLDFKSVIGIDSSAMSSFAKIHAVTEREGVTLVFTAMAPEVEQHWKSAYGLETRDVQYFPDLETALEVCEGQVLREHAGGALDQLTFEQWLEHELGGAIPAQRLRGYLERRALAAGEVLCAQGSPGDAMYLVERGRLGLEVTFGSDKVRLRSMGRCTTVGEMGLYRSSTRSASVVAEKDSIVHVLTGDAFGKIEREDPTLAAAFHAAMVRTLADRLEFENRMVAALQR
jgi:SulP family sulfate permease